MILTPEDQPISALEAINRSENSMIQDEHDRDQVRAIFASVRNASFYGRRQVTFFGQRRMSNPIYDTLMHLGYTIEARGYVNGEEILGEGHYNTWTIKW